MLESSELAASDTSGIHEEQQATQPAEGPCDAEQVVQQREQQGPAEVEVLSATEAPSTQFCLDLERLMHMATWAGVQATKGALSAHLLQTIVLAVTPFLSKEPTVVEVQPASQQQRVTVVGDTHGQYHDLCRLFELYGHPSQDRLYIFNGDYVDRGAWGVETLALLLAWKWLLPNNVYLLRGNHETNMITRVYGFYAELRAKYGAAAKDLFTHIRRMFAHLPLAALVEGNTLVLHGGLFRAPAKKGKVSKRRRSGKGVSRGPLTVDLSPLIAGGAGGALNLGTLDDLRKASKGGQDPDPDRSVKNIIASDVLWSDPVSTPGLMPNEARGCGTVYGPDATEAFLSANHLKLIIRSHEGPDARDKRIEDNRMPAVDTGYAVDHQTASGRLVTLFSAPDYPQFMAEGEQRYNNRAAVLHLTAPDYATPEVESFEAKLPRPQADSYYDVPGFSDDGDEEELEQHSNSQQATASGSSAEGTEQVAAAASLANAGEQSVAPSTQPVPQPQSKGDATAQETGLDPVFATAEALQVFGGHSAQPSCSAVAQQTSKIQAPKLPCASDMTVQPKPKRQPASGHIKRSVPAPLSPLQQHELSASLLETGGATAAVAGIAARQEGTPDVVNAGEDSCGCVGAEPPSKRHKAAGNVRGY